MHPIVTGAIVSALTLSVLGFMIWHAPRGWQDADGFHEGDEHARDDNLGI